jgi:hypothetical protein
MENTNQLEKLTTKSCYVGNTTQIRTFTLARRKLDSFVNDENSYGDIEYLVFEGKVDFEDGILIASTIAPLPEPCDTKSVFIDWLTWFMRVISEETH